MTPPEHDTTSYARVATQSPSLRVEERRAQGATWGLNQVNASSHHGYFPTFDNAPKGNTIDARISTCSPSIAVWAQKILGNSGEQYALHGGLLSSTALSATSQCSSVLARKFRLSRCLTVGFSKTISHRIADSPAIRSKTTTIRIRGFGAPALTRKTTPACAHSVSSHMT